MEEREKKLAKYLATIKKVRKDREKELKKGKKKGAKKKSKRDYAVDELPEREAVKKATRFVFTKLFRRGKKKAEIGRKRKAPLSAVELSKEQEEERKQLLAKRKERRIKFLNRCITVTIHAVLFLTPLALVPVTPSPTELPKQFILSVFTGLAAFFWLAKMIVADKFEIKKSFLSIPIGFFVIAYFLSSMLSVYRDVSIWGHFQSEGTSLASVLMFVLFFYVTTNHIHSKENVQRLLATVLLSGFISSMFAVLQLNGIHVVGAKALAVRSLNTIGSFYSITIYLSALAILATGLYVFSKKKLLSALYLLCTAGYVAFLIFMFYWELWISFTLSAGVILAIAISRKKISAKHSSIFLPTVLFMFSLFVLLLGHPIIKPKATAGELLLGNLDSFKIATQSIKKNPFLGSGPGTFGFNFELFKPDMGHFSTVGIDQPSSHVLLILGTVGVVTSASYAFLLFILGRFTVANSISMLLGRNKRGDAVVTAVSILWIFLTITSFFYIHNISLMLLWWFALAVIDINRPVHTVFSAPLTVPQPEEGSQKDAYHHVDFRKISLVVSLAFVAYTAVVAAFFYNIGRHYRAAYYYQSALNRNVENKSLTDIHQDISRAALLDDNRDLYHRNVAIVSFAMAKERINKIKKNVSGEDSKYISSYIAKALNAAERAAQINPYDFENYKNMAWVYQEMGGLNENYLDKSLSFYQKAQELSRNNPDLNYQIANLYLDLYNSVVTAAQKQKTDPGPKAKEYLLFSEENLKKALEIDRWHFGANILLVTIYEQLGENEKAYDKSKENAQFFPDNPQAQFGLAVQEYKRGHDEEAQGILKMILDTKPDYSNARYLLGFSQAKTGDLDSALDNFEKVQRYNIDNELLAKIISDLRDGNTDFLNASQKETSGVQAGTTETDSETDLIEMPDNSGENPE